MLNLDAPLRYHRTWPRPTAMPSVFTAFVRSLQGEETPDTDLFRDAWQSLQALLENELRKKGLWQSPPCYVGIYGAERWDGEEGERAHALGELVADCYAFIFVERLRSLKLQLLEKADIHGLVVLNVRHFLFERQREHDPVGYRLFEILQSLVQEAVAAGHLHVLAGDERVRNDTVLGFTAPAAGAPAPAAWVGAEAAHLERLVVRWNDALLGDLLGGRGHRQSAAVEDLRRRVLDLTAHGVQAFRFKDLLDPLKHDARVRWAALLANGAAPPSRRRSRPAEPVARDLLPEGVAESRQSLQFLTRCVSVAIQRLETDSPNRDHLSALWQYLRSEHSDGEGLPSYRQLSRRLQIPRERLPGLLTALRQLTARCRAAAQARRAARPSRSPQAGRGASPSRFSAW